METRCGQNGSQRIHFEHLGGLAPDIARMGPVGHQMAPGGSQKAHFEHFRALVAK